MILPGDKLPSTRMFTRCYLVPLPRRLPAEVIERLGDAVHRARVNHLEIVADTREEAREIAAQLLEDASQ